MDTNKYLATLNYQPIDTLPWIEEDLGYDGEVDIRRYMPVGVVLRRDNGCMCIIGHNVCGRNTTGCDCCSELWEIAIDRYTHWAWIFDVKE